MKNISKFLQKGNLTPRERIMTVIKNDIHREKTGESILRESDVYALSSGWISCDNSEVREYNKYWEAWDLFIKLGMDIQTLYHIALLNLAEIEKTLILYYFNDDRSQMREAFDKQSSQEQQEEMYQYILESIGLEHQQGIEVLMDYGFLFEVMKMRNINEYYGQLLRYKEVTDKMSNIIGEEVSYFAQDYLTRIEDRLYQTQLFTYGIQDQMMRELYMENDLTFSVEVFFTDLRVDLNTIKSCSHKSLDIFEEQVKKLLGNEWLAV